VTYHAKKKVTKQQSLDDNNNNHIITVTFTILSTGLHTHEKQNRMTSNGSGDKDCKIMIGN